jgi:hypothetical protein
VLYSFPAPFSSVLFHRGKYQSMAHNKLEDWIVRWVARDVMRIEQALITHRPAAEIRPTTMFSC